MKVTIWGCWVQGSNSYICSDSYLFGGSLQAIYTYQSPLGNFFKLQKNLFFSFILLNFSQMQANNMAAQLMTAALCSCF